MLTLEGKLTLDKETIESQNLAMKFDKDDLASIGAWVVEGYDRDKSSRLKWENRTASAMDLAMQIQEQKTFPWPDCSNVRFPLVTIAVMQFHARAYATIVDGANVVKSRVIGPDPTGVETARSQRVGTHMSWQLLEQDESWEPQHDRLLINLATIGSAFKKSYYSGKDHHNKSDLVMAKDLVLDYWAKSVASCPRKTHVIPMFRNELHERIMRKTFCDVREEPWFQAPAIVPQTQQQIESNKRAGVEPPQPDETTPYQILEQHCELDLDDDGYAEPYVITVEHTTKTVLRIVTRFDREEDIERNEAGEVVTITAFENFTKYTFLPSPDGGIYDIGFGVLLGPLNESTNSLINQLIDAGTMSVTAGGFLGRGVKVRGGVYTFAPLEWKRVDSTGDDLNKNIVPLPVREPSAVLFNLLTLLVNYTGRVSGSTDMMVGENPGQNTPAETARTMVEQGMKIYNSIFKRIWRSMKEEFGKLYILNALYMPYDVTYGDKGDKITQADYRGDPGKIVPVADPNVTSDTALFQQAQAVKASSMQTAGYDPEEVERFFLRSLKVGNVDALFPGPKKMPPGKSEKIQIEEMRTQLGMAKLQQANMQFAAELMEEQRMHNAEIDAIKGKLMLEAQSIQTDVGDQQVNMLNAMLNMHETRSKALETKIKAVLEHAKLQNEQLSIFNDRLSIANDARQIEVDRLAIEKEAKEPASAK